MIPLRMESYRYWAQQIQDTANTAFMGKPFPFTLSELMKDGDVCPICDGWQQDEEGHYCICSTLKWAEEQGNSFREYERPVQTARLDEMVPMKSTNSDKQASYDKMWEDQLKIIAYVANWMDSPKYWISLFGGNGTGKTHVLRAIKTAMPSMAFYISVSDFQSRVFAGLKEDSYEDFLEFISCVPILLLDDWGIEHTTSMSTDALASVIDRRYSNYAEFPTVVTTNAGESIFDSPDIAIKRIASRIGDRQICHRFFIKAADFRLPDSLRQV